ncbi:MAG: dockerin type I repeat-containing protein [Clostridia bacterium]|nr:dockerin type I repeat-containing protein [Clostridia bacterium]
MLPRANDTFNKKTEAQLAFGGYHRDLVVPEGSFYDMQDASCERYPVLTRRTLRRKLATVMAPQGLGEVAGKICWARDNTLYYNNVPITPIRDDSAFPVDPLLTANGVACNKGDINADGSINLTDVLAAMQLAARKKTPVTTSSSYDDTVGGLTKAQKVLRAADIDGDGKVTVADALAILRKVVFAEPPLTCDADLNGDGQITLEDAFLCAEIAQGADAAAQEDICKQMVLDGRTTLDYQTVFKRAHVDTTTLTDPIGSEDASAILAYLYGSGIYTLQSGEKQLVAFGTRLLIFPDKLYFDAETQEFGRLEAGFTYSNAITVTPCTIEGTAITITTTAETPPASPADGEYWLDTSSEAKVLKLWSDQEQKWVSIPTAYAKISATGIGKKFRDYDGVNIKLGNENPDAGDDVVNGNSYIIWGHGDDYIIITAFASDIPTTNGITVKRVIPDMDFVCEKDNRLWGCSSANNEIYCSVLGDPSNFYRYLGVSGDGWAASLGSPGEFTGCIAYDDSVLFFKEHTLHRVYGNKPANFTVSTEECEGVEKTSGRSLAIVGGVLYYNSPRGVQAYYSSFRFVGAPFGGQRFTHASGCAFERKYYFSAYDGAEWCLFVYDTEKSVWTKESSPGGYAAPFWTEWDGDLVFCANNALYSVKGESHFFTGTTQDNPEWFAETGDLLSSPYPDKHIHGLKLRYRVPTGGSLAVYIAYDGGGYERVWYDDDTERIIVKDIPFQPERCDYYRVRFVCAGAVEIYSVARVYSE